MNQLQLFTVKNCEGCENLKNYLRSIDIEYTVVDIFHNRWAAELMRKYQLKTVPQVFYLDQVFVRGGYRSIKTMRKHEIEDRMTKLKEKHNASNS